MDVFAGRLKERAAQLGISDREAARRCDLEERRYAHYASGRSEPNLVTLVKIARRLETTPDWLLGVDEVEAPKKKAELIQRLTHAARLMTVDHLKATVIQAEALAREDDFQL